MNRFANENVNFDALKTKAYNYRWAEVGDGIIPLTAADSDFPVSEHIRKALGKYIEDGYFSYTPKGGLPEFKEAIYNYVKNVKKEAIDPDCILPIDSAARGMYIIAEAVLKEGDEAIVFNPVDFLFRHSMSHAGAKIIEYPVKVKDQVIDLSDLESYITPKTKMIGLCNPHNPLGLLYTKENLEILLDLAEKYDLYIMNDEIWSDITYPEKPFLSLLSIGERNYDRVLTVYGFSKAFGIAGLRVGCIYTTNKQLFEKAVNVSCVNSTAGGISSLSQVAGTACLNDSLEWLAEFRAHLAQMRDYAYERVNAIPGLSCYKPEGTFLLYVDMTPYGMTGDDFCEYLKAHAKVAFVPGGDTFFGSLSEGHIRICFSTSQAVLEEAFNRVEAALMVLAKEKNLI